MNLQELKIGYVPLTEDLSGPGDRRRFVSYANDRKLNFEVADSRKSYDVVYLTYMANNAEWMAYKKKHGSRVKLIYELVDSYMAEQPSVKSRLRGLAKFFTGKSDKLYLDYRKSIAEVCRISDAVVCSTLEQLKTLQAFNQNVHLSLDVFDDDISATKDNFGVAEKLKLVWEGQPYTISNLLAIKDVLNELHDEIELHLVTDVAYFRYSKKYFKRKTLDILKDLTCEIVLHPWEKATFSKHVCECDLAIIPIDLKNPLATGKPENKLVLFWMSQMPVITSPTPAYSRVMQKSGINMCAGNLNEWKTQIRHWKDKAKGERAQIADQAKRFSQHAFSREKLYHDWDNLLVSVL